MFNLVALCEAVSRESQTETKSGLSAPPPLTQRRRETPARRPSARCALLCTRIMKDENPRARLRATCPSCSIIFADLCLRFVRYQQDWRSCIPAVKLPPISESTFERCLDEVELLASRRHYTAATIGSLFPHRGKLPYRQSLLIIFFFSQ